MLFPNYRSSFHGIWAMLTTSIVLLTIGCSPAQGKAVTTKCAQDFSGEITQKWLDTVGAMDCEKLTLRINSYGGETHTSLDFALYLRSQNTHIIVDEYCISGCAAFLLPAATSITFKDNPLIGFHTDPIARKSLAKHYKPPGLENCQFLDTAKMEKLYKTAGTKTNFWELQMSHLKMTNFNVSDKHDALGCPNMYPTFKNSLRFPKSSTMKKYLGLNFRGSVCADSPSCGRRDLKRLRRKGRFVIDDRLVVLR